MYFYKLSDLHTVGKSLLFGLEIKKLMDRHVTLHRMRLT